MTDNNNNYIEIYRTLIPVSAVLLGISINVNLLFLQLGGIDEWIELCHTLGIYALFISFVTSLLGVLSLRIRKTPRFDKKWLLRVSIGVFVFSLCLLSIPFIIRIFDLSLGFAIACYVITSAVIIWAFIFAFKKRG
jgi:hypothetical protein